MKKMCHCINCGEEIGMFNVWPGDLPTCGKGECERVARDEYAARDADARENAERDNYDRYR